MIKISSLKELRELKIKDIEETKIYCLDFPINDKKKIILFGAKLKVIKRQNISEDSEK